MGIHPRVCFPKVDQDARLSFSNKTQSEVINLTDKKTKKNENQNVIESPLQLQKDLNKKRKWFPKFWYKNFPTINVVLTLTSLLFMFALVLAAFSKVEIEAEGWCNSGYVGLDIEANNVIQNMSCYNTLYNATTGKYYHELSEQWENQTCFKEDLLLKHINLKDIEGLNCQGSTKIKAPVILTMLGLFEN